MTDDPVTAVQYGIGPIGARIVGAAVEKGVEFVGAIDIDPEKVGEDLGTVAGLDQDLGTEVTDDAEAALAEEPDLVFHSTLSSIEAVKPQLVEAFEAGADVVSTTEELSYPWRNNPDIANVLDRDAKDAGGTVLGTGINPGFAMDFLPSVLTLPCRQVDRIEVHRVQNAAERRSPLQEKVGAGTSVETFEEEIATEAGHVGLPESIAMLAAALGWELDAVGDRMEPVIADERVESEYFTVESGEVAGQRQIGTGIVDGEKRIKLTLEMYLGAPDPRDEVNVQGVPDLTVRNEGGFHGDVTTPEIVVNSARRVMRADPGLKTMIDLPPGTWRETVSVE